MKRINVFMGNYGSGKTEISLNIAKKIRKKGGEVLLIDMDIVNPYFRSSEHTKTLEELGIEVISPTFANTGVDLPTLSPRVYSVLSTKKHVVMDCGGDPAGAKAMGFLARDMDKIRDEIDVFFVINTCRPLQETTEATIQMMDSIEHTSKLKITKLILNSNVADDTTLQDLINGLDIAERISEVKKLDIEYICGTKGILDEFKSEKPEYTEKLLYLDIHMRPDWMI